MFSSSIRFNISSTPAKHSFPSRTPLSAIFVIPTIGSSRNMALRFVAAFLLAHGIAKKMLKSATDVVICSQKKFRQPPHNIVVKLMYMDWHVVRRDDNTGVLVYSTDFTNTYYHPSPAHIG